MNNPMDLTKFDGHSQGPWEWIPGRGCDLGKFRSDKDGPVCTFGYRNGYEACEGDEPVGPDKALIEAAPCLLAEVKSLRMEVAVLTDENFSLKQQLIERDRQRKEMLVDMQQARHALRFAIGTPQERALQVGNMSPGQYVASKLAAAIAELQESP